MSDKSFTVEIKQAYNQVHSIFLRTLYMPIIGVIPSTLYSLLKDFNFINKDSRIYEKFTFLTNFLQISYVELEIALKKLEAVGLIRTFISADDSKYIFVVNEPLAPEAFRKNSFLYKQAIEKIGELTYEKVEFSTKSTIFNKDDFAEVTAKYQDIFTLSTEEQPKEYTTQEIPVLSIKSIEDAIMGLNAFQFVKYLSNESVTPTQQAMLQRITQLGFSNPSINLITNYVFTVNGKVVSAHIEQIANDLAAKSVKGFDKIRVELENALKSKKVSSLGYEKVKEPEESKQDDENGALSWDEIFLSLGGEF